ncbi:hypothetical protein GRI43_02320 [Altererythrobacter luteolus]|uniref:Uncharacterized protein n=1 Tax=Pontixanthobacter luteolus TaxID=295089 RepID=A0A6I4UWI4_9SPHN|nr:hypothetical protein [Pontixanthobacter luteolus]MXP46227.1 hypothetical protein [Pontixanthobacter luteolus]
MTLDEGLALEAFALSCRKPDRTRRNMDILTGGGQTSRAITVACALQVSLENAGSPLEG